MFALEAVKAKHGDCLLLHVGGGPGPVSTILIDGGPGGTWTKWLKPRLAALAAERGLAAPFRFPLVMVTHLDDDHINGVLDLTNSMIEAEEAHKPRQYRIDQLWHNTLEGLVGMPLPAGQTASVTASLAPHFPDLGDLRGQKVLSSIPQAESLLKNAGRLHIPVNTGPATLIQGGLTLEPVPGLAMRVVAPTVRRLSELRDKWQKELEARRAKGAKTAEDDVATAAYSDPSAYNLSSIVVLAERAGRRILLTGDARGDDILEGLADASLLDSDGRLHVDILKLPHHGSRNNVEVEFFRRITADHYVVSGDQVKFPNPHTETFEMLRTARPDTDRYTVWMTYDLPSVEEMFPDGRCRVPEPTATSITVDLDTQGSDRK